MGKDLVLKILRHEKTNEIPWVPFAGVHAGLLKGYSAIEVLQDADKLYESLLEVNKLYTPDGMPIMFDLQIEAEILGCELRWSKDSPPSVVSHPLASEKKIPCLCKIPDENSGRIPMITDVMKRVKKEIGDEVALYGLICGPLTLASHLRGSGLFMDMIRDPEFAKDLFEFCAKVNIAMTDIYLDAGMDIIAVVDPLVSQVSPKHFEELLSESFTAIFDYIRINDATSCFFVCGNATSQIDVMCKTNPDGISVDENVNLIDAKAVTDKYNITIGGNIPLTTTMLFGNQQDNMKYVVDLLDNISHDNLIISPGCDMPYNIPPENTIAVTQAIKETDSVRKMIENYESTETDIDIELPEYDKLTKPLVEVFTLDSTMCAACTYMLKAAMDAKDEFGDDVDVVEYKYTVKEDIARIKKMGVEKLPSLYINGDLKWSSIIPSRIEYFNALKEYM
ncbi:MAG: uroporphyrinogen decarboxylase family protein [Tissierellia bacterium]|nr:uroporphyrinogen decarboxylase family protein [Tissierellia bacterium]